MPLPEYDPIRRRIQSTYSQKRSEGEDALKRRMASQGMLQSGAYQKLAQEQETDYSKQESDAMGQVDFLEAQEAQRRKEIDDQRKFQREERLGGQEFQAGEAGKQRGFQRGLFDTEMAFKEKTLSEEGKRFWAGFEEQKRQFGEQFAMQQSEFKLRDDEFKENRRTNEINSIMALKEQGLIDDDEAAKKLSQIFGVPYKDWLHR